MMSSIWILPTLKPLLPGSPSLPGNPCGNKWRRPSDIVKGKTIHPAEMERSSPLTQENLECPSLLWHLMANPNPVITIRIRVTLFCHLITNQVSQDRVLISQISSAASAYRQTLWSTETFSTLRTLRNQNQKLEYPTSSSVCTRWTLTLEPTNSTIQTTNGWAGNQMEGNSNRTGKKTCIPGLQQCKLCGTLKNYSRSSKLHLLSFDVQVLWWVNILKRSWWPLEALVPLEKTNTTPAQSHKATQKCRRFIAHTSTEEACWDYLVSFLPGQRSTFFSLKYKINDQLLSCCFCFLSCSPSAFPGKCTSHRTLNITYRWTCGPRQTRQTLPRFRNQELSVSRQLFPTTVTTPRLITTAIIIFVFILTFVPTGPARPEFPRGPGRPCFP